MYSVNTFFPQNITGMPGIKGDRGDAG